MVAEARPVVLVTGAAGALGRVLVGFLSTQGQRVIAVDRPHTNGALLDLAQATAGVVPVEVDPTASEAWPSAMRTIVAEHGVPEGAVCVAGGYRGGKRSFEGGAGTAFRAMLEMNAESANSALSALLPPMVSAGRGSIVLIGSRAAVRPWESAGAAAYAASKAAVVALTQAVAAEVLQDGVRVNVVLPSTLDTPQNRSSMPASDPSRWVSLGSLCQVINFLLSDAARDITGAALPVYGRVGV